MKITKPKAIEWTNRIIVYLLGMFVIAIGVNVAIKSDMGVSSATSLPYVLSQYFTDLSTGTWTTIVYCVIVLLQLAILRKDFKWYYIFQFAVSTVFGFFVDWAGLIINLIIPNKATHIAVQFTYTAISLIVIAIGVILYLAPNIMSMPVEGFAQALSKKTKLQFSTAKMITDSTLTVLAVICSIIFWNMLDFWNSPGRIGVGTLILAFGTGLIMKPINRLIKTPLHDFLFGKPQTSQLSASEDKPGSEQTTQQEAE